MNTFRDNGAVGALLDEYERAILELQDVINGVTEGELKTIVDSNTDDPDCRSIQTILTHVVRAGYCYVIEIRRSKGEPIEFVERKDLGSIIEYEGALGRMFRFNEKLFDDYPELKIEEHEPERKIKTRWGQYYDVEQLMEHAIVHILRHRRQIERFLIKMKNPES